MATNLHQTATVHPVTSTPPRLGAEPGYSLRPCLCLRVFLVGSFFTILFTVLFILCPNTPLITFDLVQYPTTISTPTWNLSLQVTNLNRHSKIVFHYLDVLLSYESNPIAHIKHGPFVQARMGRTVLYTNLTASEHAVRKMVEDQTCGGLLVQIQSLYAIHVFNYKTDKSWNLKSWNDHFNMG